MTLVLSLESGPHPQTVGQIRIEDGVHVIGRSREADWCLEDPENYVSRQHCTIAVSGGRYIVTDTSSGGLYVDGSSRPLGNGASADLRDGMRLRLGSFVLRVEIRADHPRMPAPPAPRAQPVPPLAATPTPTPVPVPAPSPNGGRFDEDAFFSVRPAPAPAPERPADLPSSFEEGQRAVWSEPFPERRGPPAFDDPMTLDPVLVPTREAPEVTSFDWDTPPAPQPSRIRERRPADAPPADAFDPPPPAAPPPTGSLPPRPVPEAAAQAAPERTASPGTDAGLEAFLRGLGLDAAELGPGNAEARLEAFGREYRQMIEGLMQLLRMRMQEKANARIAQTVVGSTANNPLKLMPTAEDALAVMLAARSPGFTDAAQSIGGAVRDLGRHQVNSWHGIQTALRRMIDRFDPKLVEAEVQKLGLLETMLAGGRKAKLWELYEKRFEEIARSAETRFLGEVGADFRDAYESEEKR